jgi:predicted glycosyltransferase involved in capsule biosynthesis
MPNTGVSAVLQSHFGSFVQVVSGLDKACNIAYARNLGVKKGDSDIILFMDDDVIIGRNDHFSRIVEIMKYNDFCCGARRFWTTTEWHKQLSLNYQMSHNLQILKAKSFLPQSIERTTGNKNCSDFAYIGNFGAIKRDVFNAVEGFDEKYEGWLYQDTDMMMRLCFNNYTYEIMSYTDMFCYHLAHPADKQLYRKVNKDKYTKKQADLKIRFNNNSFFGRFDDDTVAVITHLSE